MKSKFKNQTEIYMIILFQLFLLGGTIMKLFSTDGEFAYIAVLFFLLSIIAISILIVRNLFKSIYINQDKIIIGKIFSPKLILHRDDIKGYWYYETIGALGKEESLYFSLKDGRTIGIHGKAYNNYTCMKNEINRFNLNRLNDYNYKETYLKYFKIALPIAFVISVTLFLISRFF